MEGLRFSFKNAFPLLMRSYSLKAGKSKYGTIRITMNPYRLAVKQNPNLKILLFNCIQWSTNNTQNEYKYLTIFVLHKTGLTGFLALRAHAKRKKNGEQCR